MLLNPLHLTRHILPQLHHRHPIHRQNNQLIARQREIGQRRPEPILQRFRIKHAQHLSRGTPHHDAIILARPDASVVVDVETIGVTADGTDESLVDGETVLVEGEAVDDGGGERVGGSAAEVEGGRVARHEEVVAPSVGSDAVGLDDVGAGDDALERVRGRGEAVDGVG